MFLCVGSQWVKERKTERKRERKPTCPAGAPGQPSADRSLWRPQGRALCSGHGPSGEHCGPVVGAQRTRWKTLPTLPRPPFQYTVHTFGLRRGEGGAGRGPSGTLLAVCLAVWVCPRRVRPETAGAVASAVRVRTGEAALLRSLCGQSVRPPVSPRLVLPLHEALSETRATASSLSPGRRPLAQTALVARELSLALYLVGFGFTARLTRLPCGVRCRLQKVIG